MPHQPAPPSHPFRNTQNTHKAPLSPGLRAFDTHRIYMLRHLSFGCGGVQVLWRKVLWVADAEQYSVWAACCALGLSRSCHRFLWLLF